MWVQWLSVQRQHRLGSSRDERGDITQTVIIVALFAAAAIAISAIIITKFTSKANEIPTG
ncbi:MAG: hypothetical protein H7288_05725 [Kineosporiaceae bacterium]|nr:hypothetical protein [Aeromicrobium sp.]